MSIGMVNTYFDVSKMTLWGEKGAREQTPAFRLSFRDGNPRFVVNTGEPMGGFINWAANYDSFARMIRVFESVIDGPNGSHKIIQSYRNKWVNDKPTNEQELQSQLVMGKKKDGVIFLAVLEENKPKIEFAFKKDSWHKLIEADQTEATDEAFSRFYALGYIDILKNVLSSALWEYTKEAYAKSEYKPNPIKGPNGQGNGGYQKKSYGGGKTEATATPTEASGFDDFDDDVPF